MQPDKAGASRKIVARLTFTSLLTAVVVIAGAITAAYVFGVMTGRGASAPVAVAEKPAQSAKEEIPVKTDILRPQDLEYAQVLRDEEKRPLPRPMPDVAAAPAEKEPEAKPAEQALLPAEKESQPLPEESAPGEMADYVFQMAALREAHAADHLREQLEGRGLRTRLERSGKLFLVLVVLRGDAQRAAEVAVIAAQLRLGQPLLRSRRAIP